ncbi:MAG: PDZ domain-containing protein [Acidimicrobiia bacterium]|nr:PDZ domain-containing protein [Acidimicrobiia bacterium]
MDGELVGADVSTSAENAEPGVPAAADSRTVGPTPGVHTPEKRRGVWKWAIAAVAIVVLIGAGWYRTDYVGMFPGSAAGLDDLVEVNGKPAPESAGEGDIHFLTVTVGSRMNVYEYLLAKLDDDVEIVDESVFTGGGSRDEARQRNFAAMDASEQQAAATALDYLGAPSIGASVLVVLGGTPAEDKLAVNDLITEVNGTPVSSSKEAVEQVQKFAPGDDVELTIDRAGKAETVRLTAADNGEGRALIGVQLVTRYQEQVGIKIDGVGGPSAGMAMTLEFIDAMSQGDMTNGLEIAVTGEILPDGTAGPVGGVPQKAIAARRADVDLMLVPEANFDDAMSTAGDLKVVAITDVQSALDAIGDAGGNVEGLKGSLAN